MGLDLTIMEETNFKTDEKGRQTWVTTVLCDMRSVHNFLDSLNWEIESGIDCCADYTFTGEQLWKCANEITDEKEKEYVLKTLEEADILNEEEYYKVCASW